METSTFEFRGAQVKVYHRKFGRPVVFLHGFLESSDMWFILCSQLSKHFNPILIDLPGHGATDGIGYSHAMELQAALVNFVLIKLRKRKVVLLGHSMGGYVALAFADKYPDKLKGLALVNSTARADSSARKANRDRGIALCKAKPQHFIRQSIPLLFQEHHRSSLKAEIKGLVHQALKMNKKYVIASIQGMKSRSSREIILKFPPYPILFVAGKKDPVIPWSSSAVQMKSSDAITPLVFEEGGHMSFLETPDELYTGIRKFLYQCLP